MLSADAPVPNVSYCFWQCKKRQPVRWIWLYSGQEEGCLFLQWWEPQIVVKALGNRGFNANFLSKSVWCFLLVALPFRRLSSRDVCWRSSMGFGNVAPREWWSKHQPGEHPRLLQFGCQDKFILYIFVRGKSRGFWLDSTLFRNIFDKYVLHNKEIHSMSTKCF